MTTKIEAPSQVAETATTESHWTRVTYAEFSEPTAHELAARQGLNAAIEKAVAAYMDDSHQDISGIELFPCNADCLHCAEAA